MKTAQEFLLSNPALSTIELMEQYAEYRCSGNEKNVKRKGIDFDELLTYIKKKTQRDFRVINKSVKQKYKARIKDGYTKEDIANAVINACKNKYHIDSNFQYLTPEFFSRADILDKFAFMRIEKNVHYTKKGHRNF